MSTPRRWIAATDFSEPAEEASRVAIAWARRLGVGLIGAHAAPDLHDETPPSAQPLLAQQVGQLRREAEARLEGWIGDVRAAGVDAESRVVALPAWQGVVGLAESVEAEGIIVGTRGHTGLRHVLLGSTAERIVRHAPCSVLVVRGETNPAAPERIVLGEDLLSVSQAARSRAIDLARALGARVDVVHAVDLGTPYLAALELAMPRQVLESVTDEARERLERLAAETPDVEIENVIVDEKAGHALCDRAEQAKAGLIVVGSHGLGGAARILLGSVAEHVVRHAPCSVLVAR